MPVTIDLSHPEVHKGNAVRMRLGGDIGGKPAESVEWTVVDTDGNEVGDWTARDQPETVWTAQDVEPGMYEVRARATVGKRTYDVTEQIFVRTHAVRFDRSDPWEFPVRIAAPVRVDLERADIPDTLDLPLWEVIKLSTEAVSFDNYDAWMNFLFCGGEPPESVGQGGLRRRWEEQKTRFEYPERAAAPLPFPDIEAYKVLKAATEAFLEFNCGVVFDNPVFPTTGRLSPSEREDLGLDANDSLESLWGKYLKYANGKGVIPYLYRVRQKLPNLPVTTDGVAGELCDKILEEKFTSPCLLELIWSYWHEEGMLVQTMNAISLRFQNRRLPRRPDGTDPLINLTIDPLRPLSNLLWGHIQDEQHRLTVARRAYEYENEYGLTLLGQAVPRAPGAERRAEFLQAFHNLLHRASIFYKEDDDTTVHADAFPVLNALREVHLLLAQSGVNQWRSVTWTARCEMLIEQWLLARQEFGQFLPSRPMVVYPERWMDRVDAMKKLQGWTDTSVRYFRDLAVFGEQLLLSIRYGDWSNVTDRQQAANWSRAWRQEAQWYIHAYQSVTGVDLSADMADVRQAEQARARALPPAFHLQRRLTEQRRAGVGASRQPMAQPSGRPV